MGCLMPTVFYGNKIALRPGGWQQELLLYLFTIANRLYLQ
jgi:hypothetical protein